MMILFGGIHKCCFQRIYCWPVIELVDVTPDAKSIIAEEKTCFRNTVSYCLDKMMPLVSISYVFVGL